MNAHDGFSLVDHRKRPHRLILLGMAFLAIHSTPAFAGDMDFLGPLIIIWLIYNGIVIVLSIVAFVQLRRIANRRMRAIARMFLLVFLYTPVPAIGYAGAFSLMPAYLYLFSTGGLSHMAPESGLLKHPFLLAWGIAMLMGLSVVALWQWFSDHHAASSSISAGSHQSE